jgi:hypothetical protein
VAADRPPQVCLPHSMQEVDYLRGIRFFAPVNENRLRTQLQMKLRYDDAIGVAQRKHVYFNAVIHSSHLEHNFLWWSWYGAEGAL